MVVNLSTSSGGHCIPLAAPHQHPQRRALVETTGKAGAVLGPHLGGSRAVVREDALGVASWWGGCEGASRGKVKAGQKGVRAPQPPLPRPPGAAPSVCSGKASLAPGAAARTPAAEFFGSAKATWERPRKLRSRQHVVFRHCFSHILWMGSLPTKGSYMSVIAPGLPIHHPCPPPPHLQVRKSW